MKTASEPRMNKAIEKGVKHKAQGPEFAWQRLQAGPLDAFGKCEEQPLH